MRTQLAERHRPLFAALAVPEAELVHQRLMASCPDYRVARPTVPGSGEELFAMCQVAGLDHAGVVLTLARETSSTGRSAIEHLVGRAIRPWQETAAKQQADLPPPKPRGVAAVRAREEHTMVVVSHVPNPKKPGSAGHARFELWRVGALVSECIAAGMWPADVRWDLNKSFVVLADADSPEGQAARASMVPVS